MYRTRLVAIGLAVLAFAGGTPAVPEMRAGGSAVTAKLQAAPALSISGGSEEDRALAAWAASRFAKAGLELPPTIVEFVGPALDRCGGAQATARLTLDPVVVSVCWGSELVMLHELAHVWEAGSVSSDQQQQFMETRTGVASWSNPEDLWAQQGREHSANVIAWALMEDPVVVGRTYPNDRASLERGFAILTGGRPLHDEGGEPIIGDRSALDLLAAQQAAALRGGIQAGR